MIGWRGEEVELVMLIRALEKKVEVEMEVKVVFKLEVKATVSRVFLPFFALNIQSGPHVNIRKRFRELFCFHKDIRSQSSKIA